MILVNTDYISGKELEMLGLVKGSTIQSKNIGRDITQGLKTLVGGELTAYNDMMNDARVQNILQHLYLSFGIVIFCCCRSCCSCCSC